MNFFFINLLLLVLVANSQTCQNNGTYMPNQNVCTCPQGFIGKTCGVPAYQLKQTFTKVLVDSNFTYAYFSPEQKVIYKFVLTFCSTNSSQLLDMLIFAQQEKKNGEIQLQPKNVREIIQITVGNGDDCKQIYSTILVSMDKKQNGELPKIVFGFKLIGQSGLKPQEIFVQCETSSIFTVNFLVTILISFFVIITFFMLASIVFMLRKRWIQRRTFREQQLNKIRCVNTIMPTKKYQTLVEQSQPNSFEEVICSICLCEFQNNQDVRKTPCGHIYHSSCLDSWCNSHFNCPICRKNFEQEQQLQIIQQSLRADNTNIRQPILL